MRRCSGCCNGRITSDTSLQRTALKSKKSSAIRQEKVELVAPPEGSAVGERLSLEGVVGGPFEPVSAAQMDKKKVLDKVLPVS